MMSFNGRPIVLKISQKSDRKSFKFFQMMEFNFIRRISKARFQKFFEENKTFVLEQSSLVKDGHLEEFTKTIFDRFLDRFFNDFEPREQREPSSLLVWPSRVRGRRSQLCDPIKGTLSARYRHQSTVDTTPNRVHLARS